MIPYFEYQHLLQRHPISRATSPGLYKYVVIDGVYRFACVDFLVYSHEDLVGETEVAQSAGLIRITTECWEMVDTRSSTLNIVAVEGDYESLSILLNRPEKKP